MIGLCDRWGKLPSQVLAEPAEALQLLEIVRLAEPDDEPGEGVMIGA